MCPFLTSVFLNSRCTINPGENEGLVRYALDTYKFLSLAQQVSSLIDLYFLHNVNHIMFLKFTKSYINSISYFKLIFLILCILKHPRIGGPGLLGHYESSDGYSEYVHLS